MSFVTTENKNQLLNKGVDYDVFKNTFLDEMKEFLLTIWREEFHDAIKNFKTVVCHGMLLASFFSRIVGMYLPGKNSLYFSQSLNFIKPAFVNDTVTVSGKIIAKSNSTKIITLKMSICNIETELVSGEAKVFLNDSNHQIS